MTEDHSYQLRDGLGFRMSRTARLMERHYELLLAEVGLSRSMWCVLVMVGLYGVATPSAMAEFLSVDRTAISRVLREMEKQGLVVRTRQDGDRRGRDIGLTDLGQGKLEAFLPKAMLTTEHFKNKLTADEFEQIKILLDKMMDGEEGALPAL
ncbi:MarR family transcriptional regulator (plasmid) [Aminobacter sp. Y103A]|uniref:MarR family winged helix-turn-helix transcriptional regulator n=1 Tax=Aminobacter sp. Y103A TaxID=1870862 RepID=UPI00257352EE|nr:MarR family transcriptional regulator [Aminobacter sp. SS-2016]BBD41094.1 MarR family transcriptional regulator [Aminobacter sp. SS-2016]